MKKTMLMLVLSVASIARLPAQGRINYSIHVSGSIVAHVYLNSGTEVLRVGNTAAETPAGNAVYLGPMVTGTGWSAQLFGGPGVGRTEEQLVALAGSLAPFRTGRWAGIFVPSVLAVPFIPAGWPGTFQLRVWDNLGGTLDSWGAAEVAWMSRQITAGKSPLFVIENLAGEWSLPANMVNFRSFNIGIPEPGAFSLVALGGLCLCLMRRK